MTKLNPNNQYMGTSLSMCVKSIINGDIALYQVLGIESSTRIANEGELDEVITQYKDTYWRKDPQMAEDVARDIYHNKIFYQPRLAYGYCLHGTRPLWICASGGSSE